MRQMIPELRDACAAIKALDPNGVISPENTGFHGEMMMAHDDNWLGPKTGSHMVVAGGCGGIGRELVAQALAHGVNVTVLDLPKAIRPDCRVAGARYVGFDARRAIHHRGGRTDPERLAERRCIRVPLRLSDTAAPSLSRGRAVGME